MEGEGGSSLCLNRTGSGRIGWGGMGQRGGGVGTMIQKMLLAIKIHILLLLFIFCKAEQKQ